MRYVVDSNVPIVANGSHTNASPDCRLKAIDFLEKMIAEGTLIVDLSGEVEEEYRKNLSMGQPGVGNRFYQAFMTIAIRRLERIDISKTEGEYDDFPKTRALAKFDLSDRKFVALSLASKAPVANALDSDWLDHRDELVKCGVPIDFVCGCNKAEWFR